MSEKFFAFQRKFKTKDFEIIKAGEWVVSMRPQQPTIGSMVLSLNRPCERLSGLSKKEGADLAKAFRLIEEIFEKTFCPDKINYLGLMMVDDQAHFHVIPRYSKPVEIDGTLLIDNFWPGPPGLQPLELSDEFLKTIQKKLKDAALKLTVK